MDFVFLNSTDFDSFRDCLQINVCLFFYATSHLYKTIRGHVCPLVSLSVTPIFDSWNQRLFHQKSITLLYMIPVAATVAVRKKVVSIGHLLPNFNLQSLQLFWFVRSNQEQLYWLHWKSKKNRTEPNELDELKCIPCILKITQPDDQLCSLTCFFGQRSQRVDDLCFHPLLYFEKKSLKFKFFIGKSKQKQRKKIGFFLFSFCFPFFLTFLFLSFFFLFLHFLFPFLSFFSSPFFSKLVFAS